MFVITCQVAIRERKPPRAGPIRASVLRKRPAEQGGRAARGLAGARRHGPIPANLACLPGRDLARGGGAHLRIGRDTAEGRVAVVIRFTGPKPTSHSLFP
jgi:hypothetical protein